jgi:hypothetical protein
VTVGVVGITTTVVVGSVVVDPVEVGAVGVVRVGAEIVGVVRVAVVRVAVAEPFPPHEVKATAARTPRMPMAPSLAVVAAADPEGEWGTCITVLFQRAVRDPAMEATADLRG